MTFETETFLTLAEYKTLSRQLLFKKRSPVLLLIAAIISAIMLIVNWVGLIAPLDSTYQETFFIFIIIGCAVLSVAFSLPEKHYNSSKMAQQSRLFVFDDEKLSYTLQGADGNIAWEYITRYEQEGNYLVLYTSDKHGLIVKTNTLNAQQINFIKSKIKMPERLGQVKPIR